MVRHSSDGEWIVRLRVDIYRMVPGTTAPLDGLSFVLGVLVSLFFAFFAAVYARLSFLFSFHGIEDALQKPRHGAAGARRPA